MPPVQLDPGEAVSLLDVFVDRVEHLEDAPVASAHIYRHRVALAFQTGSNRLSTSNTLSAELSVLDLIVKARIVIW